MPPTRPRCQCISSCKRIPLPGNPFCVVHQTSCPRIAPLSGSEPLYAPEFYNKTRRIRDSHNCFAYAFNHIEVPTGVDCNEQGCFKPFHQPGRKSGFPKWNQVNGKRCPDLLARLYADVPGLKRTTFTRKCPAGMSKIAYVVDPKEDYHFYRQDRDGFWSHKPGATPVKRTDATGRAIYDPELATRNYMDKGGNLNYSKFCGFLCAPRRKTLRFGRGGSRRPR